MQNPQEHIQPGRQWRISDDIPKNILEYRYINRAISNCIRLHEFRTDMEASVSMATNCRVL